VGRGVTVFDVLDCYGSWPLLRLFSGRFRI